MLGTSAVLAACGSSSSTGGTGGGGATSATSSSTGGHGGSSSSTGSGTGGGVTIDIDSGTEDDASECKHLNIGILGNPGANASANFQQWLELSGTSVKRIHTSPDETLTAATLQPFDVVILDWLTRDYTAAEAAVLGAFVSAGGGVASMSGYNDNTSNDWRANSLLEPLQVAYSGSLLNGPATSFATHPITAGLTSVTFAGGYPVADLGGSGSTRTPIAFLPGDVTVGYAIEMGQGHGFVWGDEWIEFDSEWSTLPEIKQLWVQVFAWISPKNTCALKPPA
ncbi:Hypothetical protein A7982_02522 [Minicystis rosea]|nr:Hypothetical protein A7982_02522 [Minicystis rosea]